jgi:hypothetical protein
MNVLSWVIAYFVAIVFAVYQGYENGKQSVQAKWDTNKAAIITAQREKEAALQANMDKLRKEKNNELARLNRHVRALSDSLRNRPERPAVPASASAGDGATGCTGAGLYKPDGEFLVGEAARAAQLRLALINCQKAYQDAIDKSAGH